MKQFSNKSIITIRLISGKFVSLPTVVITLFFICPYNETFVSFIKFDLHQILNNLQARSCGAAWGAVSANEKTDMKLPPQDYGPGDKNSAFKRRYLSY